VVGILGAPLAAVLSGVDVLGIHLPAERIEDAVGAI
jgi:hypothetical protein